MSLLAAPGASQSAHIPSLPPLPPTAAVSAGRGGQPHLLIDSAAGRAEIYLHGATLTSWRPRGHEEVYFTSERAIFDGVAEIRGGAPVCAPWFGPAPAGSHDPLHGWARTESWTLAQVTAQEESVTARFTLHREGLTMTYEISVGESLHLFLTICHTGSHARRVEAALHHYWAVGDVTAVDIEGLEGQSYLDMVAGGEHTQLGALRLRSHTDRIYRCTRTDGVACSQPLSIVDPMRRRRIELSCENTEHTVVWNPWTEGSAAFADLAAHEWPTFVCVETAMIRERAALLEPGQSVSMGVTARVFPM